jgi:hypothetical protein
MISRLKIVMVAFAALGLAGCSGGGGGGGSAQNSQTQMGSGGTHIPATYASNWTSSGTVFKPLTTGITRLINDLGLPLEELGTLAKPFWQQSLAYRGITDPNAVVLSPSNIKYDLRWGTPDPAGPGYALNFGSSGTSPYQLPKSYNLFGAVLSSSSGCNANVSGCGFSIRSPHSDVINAWNAGWTGKGVNILVFDGVGKKITGSTDLDPHAATVGVVAQNVAWDSKIYGLSYNSNTGPISDFISGATATPIGEVKLGVVNASFGANLQYMIGRPNSSNNPWTQTELMNARNQYQILAVSDMAAINSSNFNAGGGGFFSLRDAVITKAVGNDGIGTADEPFNYFLMNNDATKSRLLLVGALQDDGYIGRRATIALYSNTPKLDSLHQARFLVASGLSPFNPGSPTYYGGVSFDAGVGTSYAAPRVAGYAAIVRQKFPNLSGANTADILLATARYDTLTCHPDCPKEIYGQGEASLSRALAPVGRLK